MNAIYKMNNIIAIYLLILSIEYIASIYYNVIVKGKTRDK